MLMLTRVTIAVAAISHNHLCPRPLEAFVRCPALWYGLFSLLVALAPGGCAASFKARSTPIPTWELAEAQPARTITLARIRIPLDHPIPTELMQPLCEEYALLMIESPRAWGRLAEDLELPDLPPEADLHKGMIVGLLADVGEASDATWPITIEEARVQEGLGWLIADFHRGIYYPLKTASYLELAYVPGMRRVRRIDINNRRFALYLPDEIP
jgi:hypothetical protein